MNEKYLLHIARKLKAERKERDLTVQTVADRAQVSKGLISKIENGRSVPSLPVLLSVIRGLEMRAEDFFKGIENEGDRTEVHVIKKFEYDSFEKEEAEGFKYQFITSSEINGVTMECVLLNLEPGAKREMVVTEAMEYKYILSGNVSYIIGEERYDLSAGDSLYFNGRIPHVPENNGNQNVLMLIVYLFDSNREE